MSRDERRALGTEQKWVLAIRPERSSDSKVLLVQYHINSNYAISPYIVKTQDAWYK